MRNGYWMMDIGRWMMILLLLMPLAYAIQPTQQYNRLLLSPFYRASITQNIQYNYSVDVIAPDGISQAKTAILTLDAWISPTRTFNAWMNDVQCSTANYTVSTTYASAGRAVITFDCTNAIRPNQMNAVRFVVSGGNIGSSTAWLDLTYMNNPRGTLSFSGTEYLSNDNGTIFLQMLDNQQKPINNSLCYLDMYSPSKAKIVNNALMTYLLSSKGLYYYDFITGNTTGVYMVSAGCFYYYNLTYFTSSKDSYTISTGATTNYGNLTYFAAGKTSTAKINGYIGFNLSNISGINDVEEVWLYLYSISKLSDPIIEIFRVTSEWNESNITWNNAPSTDMAPYDSSIAVIGWNYWNITVLAKSWLNGTFINYGMMLNGTFGGGSFNFSSFSSRENSAELSPRLLVKYKSLQQVDTIRGSGEVHVSASICPSQQDLTNYSRISNLTVLDVWSYANRNLTYYPAQQDMTNYTYITESVWSYVARYVHGVLI